MNYLLCEHLLHKPLIKRGATPSFCFLELPHDPQLLPEGTASGRLAAPARGVAIFLFLDSFCGFTNAAGGSGSVEETGGCFAIVLLLFAVGAFPNCRGLLDGTAKSNERLSHILWPFAPIIFLLLCYTETNY